MDEGCIGGFNKKMLEKGLGNRSRSARFSERNAQCGLYQLPTQKRNLIFPFENTAAIQLFLFAQVFAKSPNSLHKLRVALISL